MRERTHEEIDRLVAAAVSWEGTPFCANSAVKGGGVCCSLYVAEVYFEAGWLPRLDIPPGSPRWSRAASFSRMEAWLDGPEISHLLETPAQEPVRAGDLFGFRIGKCVHHLAISMPGGGVAHAIEGHGASMTHGIPETWAKRLVRTWRPIAQ